MALANRIQWRVALPHEDGQWFEFRRLSARQLERAADVKQSTTIAKMAETPGFAEVLRSARSDAPSQPRELVDPLDAYDPWTLLKYGVVSWSYADLELTPDAIEELDKETLDWAARQLVPKPLPGDQRLEAFRGVSEAS